MCPHTPGARVRRPFTRTRRRRPCAGHSCPIGTWRLRFAGNELPLWHTIAAPVRPQENRTARLATVRHRPGAGCDRRGSAPCGDEATAAGHIGRAQSGRTVREAPMPTGARGGVWANRFREYFLLGTDFFDSRTIARASPHPRAAPVMPSPIPCRRSAPAGIGAQRPDRSAPCVHRRSFHSPCPPQAMARQSGGAATIMSNSRSNQTVIEWFAGEPAKRERVMRSNAAQPIRRSSVRDVAAQGATNCRRRIAAQRLRHALLPEDERQPLRQLTLPGWATATQRLTSRHAMSAHPAPDVPNRADANPAHPSRSLVHPWIGAAAPDVPPEPYPYAGKWLVFASRPWVDAR